MTRQAPTHAEVGRVASSHGPRWPPSLATTVDGIVKVVLPDFPQLDPEARGAVESDVSQYVIASVRSMPGFLRLPYAAATFGFEWLALLLHGRRFRRLPRAQRSSYLARWSEAPVLPMRDFVRLLRSSALLAYFDHHLVTERLAAPQQDAAAPVEPRTTAEA